MLRKRLQRHFTQGKALRVELYFCFLVWLRDTKYNKQTIYFMNFPDWATRWCISLFALLVVACRAGCHSSTNISIYANSRLCFTSDHPLTSENHYTCSMSLNWYSCTLSVDISLKIRVCKVYIKNTPWIFWRSWKFQQFHLPFLHNTSYINRSKS